MDNANKQMTIADLEAAKIMAEALTFQRLFTMLYLAKVDFSYVVKDRGNIVPKIEKMYGKKSKEYKNAVAYYDAHSFGYDAMTNAIRKLDATVKDRAGLEIVKKELTSERIADLHSFLDLILEVENVNVLNDIFKFGIEESRKLYPQTKTA